MKKKEACKESRGEEESFKEGRGEEDEVWKEKRGEKN